MRKLKNLDAIQIRRKEVWNNYNGGLKILEAKGVIGLPKIPSYATNNAHMFYIVCKDLAERMALIKHLKANDIGAVFHYLSLHKSPYYHQKA